MIDNVYNMASTEIVVAATAVLALGAFVRHQGWLKLEADDDWVTVRVSRIRMLPAWVTEILTIVSEIRGRE